MAEFDFDISLNSAETDLTVANILKRVPEIVIWRYYIGTSFRLEKSFNAPYRVDNDASFGIREDTRGRLMFKDFGRPGMYGDIFNYLQKVYNITFIESLEMVNEDFNLGLKNKTNVIVVKKSDRNLQKVSDKEVKQLLEEQKRIKETQNQILFQAVTRKWEEKDLLYWSNFGITQKTLERYHVYPALKVFKNKQLTYIHNPDNPCYVYFFPKSKHVKFYLPFSPDRSRRFFGNVNNLEDIQGYYQCDVKREDNDGNKLLILTKSMKDVMLLREFGYDAMALHGENHRFEDDFIRHIKKYYSKIVSLYDRDRAGILGAKRLWKEHKIKAFFIHKRWYCKDISDMFMTYGNDIVEDFLVSLIKKS